jgi:hypothetical protein
MNYTRKRIISPDRPTFNAVANLLSVAGVSVNAGSPITLVHVVGQVSPKTTEALLELGAQIIDI